MQWKIRKTAAEHPAAALCVILAGVLLIYGLSANLFFISGQKKDLIYAYEEIALMDLPEFDEEDEQILQSFQGDGLQFWIAKEDFTPVYTSGSVYDSGKRIERYIKGKLDQYQKKPSVTVRRYRDTQVIRLRAIVTCGQADYYVYIRKELRAVYAMIAQTILYFLLAGLLAAALYGAVLRRRSLCVKLVPQGLPDSVSQGQHQLDEAQKEFVANISHELKTPLAVISGQVEMLQGMGDEIDRDYYFSSIREEIDKMSKMVGDLLDITIMDHHIEEMELSRVNLTELMEYMVLKYDALFQKNKIKVESELEKDCMVHGNRMYLEQAVNNYIMNAFQHTGQGKNMRICLRTQDRDAYIGIYNEGPLVPAEDIGRIWQSFYKNSQGKHKKDAKMSNAGLGLYMVKKIMEQHHGSCGAENKEKGVEFWMRIPLAQ